MYVEHSTAADYFSAIVWKQLRKIDLPFRGSNQHELQGIGPLKEMFGTERIRVDALWRGFDADGDLRLGCHAEVTWYNAREKNQSRAPEYRLYYPRGTPLDDANEGDLLVVARRDCRVDSGIRPRIVFYVIPGGSELCEQLAWLLSLESDANGTWTELNAHALSARKLQPAAFEVLKRLEPDLQAKISQDFHELVELEFGDFFESPHWNLFPSSIQLADFAWRRAERVPSDVDTTLDNWLAFESRAFFLLEERMLRKLLETGFHGPDEFISLSLQVQNRRKARRGHSLERHLGQVFRSEGLRFETQCKTEGNSTVDFLFPDLQTYRDALDPADSCVISLAAKTSVKDRWRQVLAEATKMRKRHLFTMEPAISTSQTLEMGRNGVSLVVPASIAGSFPPPGTEVLTLAAFVRRVQNGFQ